MNERLTIPQQNIWNLQKFYTDTAISNQCGAIIYNEKRDLDRMKNAIREIIWSQAGFRLRFEEGNNAYQYVADDKNIDIEALSFENEESFDCYANQFASEPMGLIDRRMYRFVVFSVEDRSGILVVLSHLISDAWTFGVLAREVDKAYQILSGDNTLSLITADYRDYIKAEQKYYESNRYEKDQEYWQEKYAVKPEETRIKLNTNSSESIESKRIIQSIPHYLEEKIANFCETQSITPAVLFETALLSYLYRINSENSTVTIGIPVLNRSNAREKNIAGMFISTMPLTISLDCHTTVLEIAKRITKEHMEIFRHQKYPYSDILKRLRDEQNFSGNLYEVMFSYQNAKTYVAAETKWYSNGYSEVPFTMHVDNRDGKAEYTLTIDYQTKVFPQKEEVELIVERFWSILIYVICNPSAEAGEIPIMSEKEKQKVLFEFNDTYVDYPREKCIHELFTDQARKTPDKTALVFEEKEFTYKQIDEMSNSVAHYLRERGLKPNEVVPIISKRSWHVIVAMIGVLKAGGAYMPVDPNYPVERIQYMLDDANAKLVLCFEDNNSYENMQIINLNDIDYLWNIKAVSNVNDSIDVCYVIFTSGSTGRPKGISITHNNLCNFCSCNSKNEHQNCISKNNYTTIASMQTCFDVSVFEMYQSFLNGHTLVLTNEEEMDNGDKIAKLIDKYNCNIIHSTPSKINMLCLSKKFCDSLKRIKIMIIGAEVFSENLYCKLLDENQKPLPIGVAGELYISGDGVGAGYLNRPDLTAEKFMLNPFVAGKRMYRTGDLACWRNDGEMDYLGRIDSQVKIRGLRIELGEIENVICSFGEIQLAAAAERKDENGKQYLIGYYTSDNEIDEKELRKYLSIKLPKYMIPNYFMSLSEIPMTPSGKIDRKKLPVPNFAENNIEYVAPTTDLQRDICSVLEKIFVTSPISITANFFDDLGGDSLQVIRFISECYTEGIFVDIQKVYENPTAEDMANYIENKNKKDVAYDMSEFTELHKLIACNKSNNGNVKKAEIGNILLTGATGFLGAHVLSEYLKNEKGICYCLVRATDKCDAEKRIADCLSYYFRDKYAKMIGNRIIAIKGDITEDNLGIEEDMDIDMIIHTAATVKHYGSYDYFGKINVNGTENVIAQAKKWTAKLIHISTISVSGNSVMDAFDGYVSETEMQFTESDLYIGQELNNVYIRSKFEAECKVLEAMQNGLEANIVRVGNLTNRYSDLKFQKNYESNAFLNRMVAIRELGCFPDYMMPLYCEFSPVDSTANAIMKIAEYFNMDRTIFHVNSDQEVCFDKLIAMFQQCGMQIEVINKNLFKMRLLEKTEQSKEKQAYDVLIHDMNVDGTLLYDSNIRIIKDCTSEYLRNIGFEWPEIDERYIAGYVKFLDDII